MGITATVARGLLAWMVAITLALAVAIVREKAYWSDQERSFYRFGPHADLRIMGIAIDTPWKYVVLACYCVTNAVFRDLQHNVLSPWITNTVQDEAVAKPPHVHRLAYEVSLIHAAYYWWDWYIYVNILLAQFDLVLIEVVSSLLTTAATTWMYLQTTARANDDGYDPLPVTQHQRESPFPRAHGISN